MSVGVAEQAVRDGDLDAASSHLQDAVRKDPAKAELRVFLFQLLCVKGEWERALTQLNVAADLDAGALAMAQMYRETIHCEALRAEVFAGKTTPVVFGEPEAWLSCQLNEGFPQRGAFVGDLISLQREVFLYLSLRTVRDQVLDVRCAQEREVQGKDRVGQACGRE